jgi:hypothetical protein
MAKTHDSKNVQLGGLTTFFNAGFYKLIHFCNLSPDATDILIYFAMPISFLFSVGILFYWLFEVADFTEEEYKFEKQYKFDTKRYRKIINGKKSTPEDIRDAKESLKLVNKIKKEHDKLKLTSLAKDSLKSKKSIGSQIELENTTTK